MRSSSSARARMAIRSRCEGRLVVATGYSVQVIVLARRVTPRAWRRLHCRIRVVACDGRDWRIHAWRVVGLRVRRDSRTASSFFLTIRPLLTTTGV